MNVIDIILIVITLIFLWKGFRTGLIGAIGGFFGVLAGIWAGTNFMTEGASWISSTLNVDNEALASILAFIGIFVAINIITSIIVMIINRIFHIIPFIDLMNKLLGAFVGLLGGILAASTLAYLLSLLSISDTINGAMLDSFLAPWAVEAAIVIKPFVPEAIRELQSIFS